VRFPFKVPLFLSKPLNIDREGIPNWFFYVQPNFEAQLPSIRFRVLQIGAYAGDFSRWLLENKVVEYLDDVDTWQGSEDEGDSVKNWNHVLRYYQSNIKSHKQVKSHKMTSDAFFRSKKSRTYNLIYIDGSHSAKQVLIDGINAFEHLELDGLMVFDDYLWENNKVRLENPGPGIDCFLQLYVGQYNVVFRGYQIWIKKI